MNQLKDERPWAKALGLLVTTVTDLLGTTFAGLGLGWLLWKKADFPWWVPVVLGTLGFVAGSYRLYVRGQQVMDEQDQGQDKK